VQIGKFCRAASARSSIVVLSRRRFRSGTRPSAPGGDKSAYHPSAMKLKGQSPKRALGELGVAISIVVALDGANSVSANRVFV
jgi:hypothetical protein